MTQEATPVLPESLRGVLDADRATRIDGHAVLVNPDWWATELSSVNAPGGPLETERSALGRPTISRAHLFELGRKATAAGAEEDDVARLLWHSLAWGTGTRHRMNRRRTHAMTGDEGSRRLEVLAAAAHEGQKDPEAAYERLLGAIPALGPSFFTKFLYFAGGGRPEHPSLILDALVATGLHQLGLHTSARPALRPGWSRWSPETYGWYCRLVADIAAEESTRRGGRVVAADEIERVLFDHGAGRTAR